MEFTAGTYYKADPKKYKTVIVFLHWLGAVPEQLKYHIKFVNKAGFDVYFYPAWLSGVVHWKELLKHLNRFKTSALNIWNQELKFHLDQLESSQSKIIFSFSLPSAAAFMQASLRRDITAVICDGGPFSQILRVSWRYLSYYQNIKNPVLKLYLTTVMGKYFQAFSLNRDLKSAFSRLPKNYPVLNFQALKDQQALPGFINKVFQSARHIHLKVCRLKSADHLEGLKKEEELYVKSAQEFLRQFP